ncbi:thioredoxin family protein [Kordiimonas gwangyangensis]|uniref:thioredoxin family protein n=1 Tax=Kordiimonas gwangyangensis TaxID=288022 RepID=UPI00036307DD|nr:thioredoxin family protein [Kordiimonas gwangyangensis]
MKLEQTSLAVLLWATFGGAMLTLVSTPADCLSTTLSALSEFGQQMVDPLSAEDGEAMPFEPSENAMADVDTTLTKARASGKLAMIVLGANWCHDSQGFVAHLNSAEMQDVIARKYEVLLVDVGYLEHGNDIVQRFGQPVVYGTPTVFVVDPNGEAVVNRKSMHQWRAAASISLKDTVDYFEHQANSLESAAEELAKANLKAALHDIDVFEEKQAERIAHAYEILGPLVALPRDERPDNFYDMWEQVRVLRYKLTDDLARLRAIAKRKAAYTEDEIQVDLPQYPAFSWE